MCMCILHIVFCTVCKYVLSICKLFCFSALSGARSQEFHSSRHLCCGDVTIKVIWFDLIWIESFQDCWWDPEFPQLSQMVQSLPGFLNLCLNVCSPSQVLWDVYTEVLEAAHPFHRGPTDHKRSVGPPVSLSEVHNQLFSFAHIQRETVVLAPWCKSLYLIQVCGLIIVGNEAQNHSIISKFDNRCGAVRGHAVMCVERVEQGAQDTTLWGSYVQGDGVLRWTGLLSAGEEILNPVTEWRV